jgi:hypothetical protein
MEFRILQEVDELETLLLGDIGLEIIGEFVRRNVDQNVEVVDVVVAFRNLHSRERGGHVLIL